MNSSRLKAVDNLTSVHGVSFDFVIDTSLPVIEKALCMRVRLHLLQFWC